MQAITETVPKKAGFFKALKTISWAYLGVRSQRGRQDDFNSITLGQTVVIGILFGVVFVITLASIAQYVSG